jgi:hypothetical protein
MYALIVIVLFLLSGQPGQNQNQTDQAKTKTTNPAAYTLQNLPALPESTPNPAHENPNRSDADSKQKLYYGLTRAEWVSSGLTLAYVVISLLAFFAIKKQANLTEKQAKSSGEQFTQQITQLTKSADAMGQIATKIEDGNKKTIRAYLTVAHGPANYQSTIDNRKFDVRPLLGNSGMTPARKVKYRIAADILPNPLPANFDFPLRPDDPGAGLIGPHQNFYMLAMVPDFVPDVEIGDIKMGTTKSLYVWGLVTYEDMFGEAHKLTFCAQVIWLGPEQPFTIFTPEHNDAD